MADFSSRIEVGQAPPRATAMDERLGTAFALAALVLAAVALRLVPVLLVPSLTWADEIFQTTEQAHRLVYGTGLVPWEFQLGVRSWLLPGFIAGIMEMARWVGDGPDFYLPVIAGVFATLAAAPVVCCFLWCRRRFGLGGAIVAAAVVATAPDLVHLGARTLSEVVAAHVMVIALFVLEPASRRRLAAGGALLGLAFVLRIQLAPALALIAGWAAWRSRGAGMSGMLVGGGGIVLLAALLDWITLGAPLASIWRYVIENVYYGAASLNGVQSWDFYAWFEFHLWKAGLAVPLLLALLGARRKPILVAAAIAIIAAHNLIAHKEYRFLYPAFVLVMISAGLGLAQFVAWGEAALARRGVRGGPVCAVAAIDYWSLLSYQVWAGPGFTVLRHVAHDDLAAIAFVEHAPQVCGVGFDYGLEGDDWIYGGYTHLHRPVPRYWPTEQGDLTAQIPGFNWLISTEPLPAGSGFAQVQCFGKVCVARRPGGCSAVPMRPLPVPAQLR